MVDLTLRGLDLALPNRLVAWLKFGIKLAFLASLLLTLVALALELGVKQREYAIPGPFLADTNPPQKALFVVVPKEGPARWWRQPMLGDMPAKPYRSFLQLRINDREIGPPHSWHVDIRTGATPGFSHWDSVVLFSLPPGVKNGPETIVTLHYSVKPRLWITLTLLASTVLLGYVVYRDWLRRLLRPVWVRASSAAAYAQRPISVLVKIPYWILFVLGCAGLIASVAFIVASLYAAMTGWAIPTTAPIHWFAIAEWAAKNERDFPYLLLNCAGIGAVLTWLARATLPQVNDERMSRRFFFWFGFPITFCALLLCLSAMWAGILRPGDAHHANIGGLVPFSDAHGHFVAAYDEAKVGTWMPFAQRRPIAAGFRTTLLFFSDYSLQIMLILQALLVAAAICFATYALMLWRGFWAGIAFFGLSYIYSRIFVPTTLTEPLGLFWALLSIPFFIESLRRKSAQPAYIALALTTIAMMTRMGSMFTIPALLIWMVWQFGKGVAAKFRIAVASICIVLSVLGTSSLLQKAYGTGPSPTTGNFAYVLCGITMGTTWEGCVNRLKAQGQSVEIPEDTLTKKLYAMAAENFRAEPGVFFKRLNEGVALFVEDFPEAMWKGYGRRAGQPEWLFRDTLTIISLIGILYFLTRQADVRELTFWALVWASIFVSAAVVYVDDGARTLAGSHPLIALFFAIGLGSPRPNSADAMLSPRLSRHASWGLAVAVLLMFVVPWTAHYLSPIRKLVGDNLQAKVDEAIVLGGRAYSGFLVVEDGTPLRKDIPSLHISDFRAIIQQSNVEFYQDLLNPMAPPLPFGFVFMPRLEKYVPSYYQFIVPAEVLERPEVPAWRFNLLRWGYKPGGYGEYWFYVTKAEPFRP
jgi:hypothetical protein